MREQRLFAMALYDLDAFREHLGSHGVPEVLAIPADAQVELMQDDTTLLAFGHTWLKWALFGKTPAP
jgi:hypothetical protein